MLEQDSQKNEMDNGTEITTSSNERWLKKAAEWNPELSAKIQDLQSDWETKEKMGRRHHRTPHT